jgi:hypothetical protein
MQVIGLPRMLSEPDGRVFSQLQSCRSETSASSQLTSGGSLRRDVSPQALDRVDP